MKDQSIITSEDMPNPGHVFKKRCGRLLTRFLLNKKIKNKNKIPNRIWTKPQDEMEYILSTQIKKELFKSTLMYTKKQK